MVLAVFAVVILGFGAGWYGRARWLPPKDDAVPAATDDLAARDKALSVLRHDVRGMLSPALLTADRLSTNPDPAVAQAAEAVIRSIERAAERLKAG